MIYSEKIKKAMWILVEAHGADTDKGGYPYIFHPYEVAEHQTTEDAVCAALLHDVIEDHGDKYSFDYMEYVKAIKGNPIARAVKIADFRHNMDASRINRSPSPKAELYAEALRYLEAENI